jgi:branched-chain amino acid transport system substrate-binding protein
MRVPRSLAAALLLGVGACSAGDSDNTTIYLGLAAPLELEIGEAARRGAMLAIEEVNEAGGINGRMLDLHMKDDRMEREEAIRVAAAFRDEGKVVAVIGHVNSGATLAAADIYNHPTNGLLEISPGATSPELSGKGAWTFRVCPTDVHQGVAIAEWTYDRLERRRAAVIYINDEYGRGVLNAFTPAFEELGGTVIAQDPFLISSMESETTFDPYLERAMAAGMDALVIIGVGEEALVILEAARRLGYDGPVLGADGLTDLKDAGSIAQGVYMATGFIHDRPDAAAREFVEHYAEHYDELPRDGAAHAYDAVMLLVEALREVGPDRRALRDYVAAVGSSRPAFNGATGTIAFDRNGDVVGKEVAIGVIDKGEVVTAQ